MIEVSSEDVMNLEFFALMFCMAQLSTDVNSFTDSTSSAQSSGVDS